MYHKKNVWPINEQKLVISQFSGNRGKDSGQSASCVNSTVILSNREVFFINAVGVITLSIIVFIIILITVLMSTTLLKKECPFCITLFSTFQKGRMHVLRKHYLSATPRSISDRNNNSFAFNKKNIAKYPNASIAYACLSCSESFEEKELLAKHTMESHIDRQLLWPL